MYFDAHSSSEDGKAQYRRLVLKHHPDKGGDAETFRTIQKEYKAFRFLVDWDGDTKGDSWADIMDKEDLIEAKTIALTNEILAADANKK